MKAKRQDAPANAETLPVCVTQLGLASCVRRLPLSPSKHCTMNGQEAFRRLVQQLQRASSGGKGPQLPGGKSFFAGSGLLVALVAGGFALNASLFNGSCPVSWRFKNEC